MTLEGLDDIDWSSLTHAYGPATTTAKELRALLSADDQERSQAFESLVASICHQGSVYPATAPAVPFLLEIATTRDLPAEVRLQVVQFLQFIAQGAVDQARYHPDWAAEDWALTLSSNLRAAAPEMLTLISGPDEGVLRAWAVWFIRTLPPAEQDLDSLRAMVADEHDDVVKASIALTLAPDDSVQSNLVSDSHALVRLAAAAQLISLGQDLDHLVTLATEAVPKCVRFSEMPIQAEDTSPVKLIASRLATVSQRRQHVWIALWLQDPAQCVEALYAAWHASQVRRSSAVSLLDPVAQALLEPPLQTKEYFGTAAMSLTMLGLPGVARLREISSSLSGDALERATFHLDTAERHASAYASELPTRTPLRRPNELASHLHDVREHTRAVLEAVKALNELAAWGPAASELIPDVEKLLDETNSATVRIHCARALAQITNNVERSVALLVREFEQEPRRGVMIARYLGEFGPRAAAALAILRHYAERDLRPRDISVLEDDLVAAACVEAISRIEPRLAGS